ncbi:EF-hand domain-containing protein [bacterium]|nr:EF-hand domain-containing protein [bacterium]MBU1884030.1 EF-hand domain-containing protein [bacterium]
METPLTENFNTVMEQFRNQLLHSFDVNKNGSMDKKEFSQAIKGLSKVTANSDKAFDAIDTNKDGKVDGDELLKVLDEAAPLLAKQFLNTPNPYTNAPAAPISAATQYPYNAAPAAVMPNVYNTPQPAAAPNAQQSNQLQNLLSSYGSNPMAKNNNQG